MTFAIAGIESPQSAPTIFMIAGASERVLVFTFQRFESREVLNWHTARFAIMRRPATNLGRRSQSNAPDNLRPSRLARLLQRNTIAVSIEAAVGPLQE